MICIGKTKCTSEKGLFRNIMVLRAWIKSKCQASKKVRAGHRGFLASTLPEVDACLGKDAVAAKAELIKWKVTLKEQLEKILPLDEQILAELVEKEDSTEEEVTEEITRAV